MKKIVIFGNSGSGKTTLAKRLVEDHQLAHFDLDLIAWQAGNPPERAPISECFALIDSFCETQKSWVIEGCYADLIEHVCDRANELIYLNLPIEECISNAKMRPWEPHKYQSKEEQDQNLSMLTDWIADYEGRQDSFSMRAHLNLFENFDGKKTMKVSNDSIGET